MPFTLDICEGILKGSYLALSEKNIIPGRGWPDEDILETIPRIINNLKKVAAPTGFESWMIINTITNQIIGDIGFKGIPDEVGTIDLGYGIVEAERRKGFAVEASAGLLHWAFARPAVRAITANCLISNKGSIKVLHSLNFKEIKEEGNMIYWKLCCPA